MSSYSYQYYTVNQNRWQAAEIKSKLEAVKTAEKGTHLISSDLAVVSNSIIGRLSLEQGYVAEGTRTLQAIGAIVLLPENKGKFGHEITEIFALAVWNYQIVNETKVPPFQVGHQMVAIVMDQREQVPVPQFSPMALNNNHERRLAGGQIAPGSGGGSNSTTKGIPGEQHLPGGQIKPGTGGNVGQTSSSNKTIFDKYGNPISMQADNRTVMRDKEGNILRDKSGNPLYVNSNK